MKNYQVFVRISGDIEVKANCMQEAEDIINNGWIVADAFRDGLLEVEIEDICEFKESDY